ncbi:MAG: glycerophosphodiester phosphodiesterase [Candidatus Hydrogenedentes bacterium]|nr:glycerophosphodiester phosphodiesterase [Candidatus Hydrogenedentota bacterium]
MTAFVMSVAMCLLAEPATEVFFQAHRGAVEEAPENTLAALNLAFDVPGAVPEVDLQTTSDGAVVCIHDDTPARTTNAPEQWRDKPIVEIPLDVIRTWDAGSWFSKEFAGEKVPTLEEVLAMLKAGPERQMYLDLKGVDVPRLVNRLQADGLERQVIFVHGDPAECLRLSALYPGARTMTWLSGPPRKVKADFEALKASGFQGLWQLQFHLPPGRKGEAWPFALDENFLREAVAAMKAAGVVPQARLFDTSPAVLATALDLGVPWFVADAPQAFGAAVARVKSSGAS